MTALYPWRVPEGHAAVPFVRPGEIVYSRIQKPRIYRFDGSWWSIQPDPSGGEVRCRYSNGRAAMVALDERNRAKARARTITALVPDGTADHMTLFITGRNATLLPGQCPPSTHTTKDCE